MLETVRVGNLALLEAVELQLAPGLNVLSGETGEGKSLLLTAIGLLLGGRARKGLVRSGAREAVVEGRFLLDADARTRLLGESDLVSPDAEELCLRRVVPASGSGRAYVDGSLVPVSVLARVGALLVDVHGQSDHLSLKRIPVQQQVLDRFGGQAEGAARWRAALGELQELERAVASAGEEDAARRDRADLLRFQLQELEALGPERREETRLAADLDLLSRSSETRAGLRDAAWRLTEGEGAVGEVCGALERALEAALPAAEPFAGLRERLAALRIEAEDLGRECAALEGTVDCDPARLGEVSARLDRLRMLARRHRVAGDDLADLADGLRTELAELEGGAVGVAELEQRRIGILGKLEKTGLRLARGRRKAARALQQAVLEGLSELRMADARFEVSCAALEEPLDPLACGEPGPGATSFLVAANPGEEPQPLGRVASGGETARIMLALRGALAGHHRIPLLIFDEIDAGIGGRVGVSFGRRIASIARHHQVLVVTHLPQVAAFADCHLRVVKTTRGGRTRTTVRILEKKDRVEELAAMLGGEIAPAAARAQARALMKEASA